MSEPPFKRTRIASVALPSLVQLEAQAVAAIMAEKGKAPARTEPYSYDMRPDEMTLISEIVGRGVTILRERGMPADYPLDVKMMAQDIATVHCNIAPLRLLRWLMSDQSDFMRDFAGLSLHLDRQAGILVRGWRPMFALEAH